MKKMKNFFGALATMAIVLSLVIPLGITVQAKPQPYTYKIRVFAGKQGKFADTGLLEKDYTGKTFNLEDIEVKPAIAEDKSEYQKYYVKGIKPSGSDVSDIIANPSFVDVDSDMDYVVIYGVRGDMVSYTVKYLDADGNELAPGRTYEGNIGDKPIVPYLYIEGYMPQAYSLTMTLKGPEERPEGNIFTFQYTPEPTGRSGGGGGDRTVYDENVVTTTNTTPVVVPGTGGDAAETVVGGGVTVVPGDGVAADTGAGDAGEAAAPAEPEQLVDLDDEEVPLANVPGSSGGGTGIGSEPGSFFVNMPPAVIVGIVSMAVLVVAAAWYLIFKRKKKGTDENE